MTQIAGLGDYAAALRMRDLVQKIVRSELESQRPPIRYATVVSIDRVLRKCVINYPGDSGNVTVSMGSIQPSVEGQVVRIDGPTGDRFISDVMGTVFTDSINAAHPTVRAATTAEITLSGLQTVDGVVLALNDRVLVKNQANQALNGVYVVKSGAWVRAADADTVNEVDSGSTWFVKSGTDNTRRVFMQVQPITTVGTSNQEFFESNFAEHVGPLSYPAPIRKGHIIYDAWNKSLVTWNGGGWEAVSNIHICTSTTRPDYVHDGHFIYETDTKRFGIMSSSTWVFDNNNVTDLSTEDLDNLDITGLSRQPNNVDATLARHYPVTLAGLLEVFRNSGTHCYQRYTTFDGEQVYTRARNGSGVWSSWLLVQRKVEELALSGTVSNFSLAGRITIEYLTNGKRRMTYNIKLTRVTSNYGTIATTSWLSLGTVLPTAAQFSTATDFYTAGWISHSAASLATAPISVFIGANGSMSIKGTHGLTTTINVGDFITIYSTVLEA